MKNKLLLTITLSILSVFAMGAIAFAAPIVDLNPGETAIGYTYFNPNLDVTTGNLKVDCGSIGVNGFYVEHAINDSLILGLEKDSGGKTWTSGSDYVRYDTTASGRIKGINGRILG